MIQYNCQGDARNLRGRELNERSEKKFEKNSNFPLTNSPKGDIIKLSRGEQTPIGGRLQEITTAEENGIIIMVNPKKVCSKKNLANPLTNLSNYAIIKS